MSKHRDWGGIIGIVLFWAFIIGLFAWSPIEAAYKNHKITCADESIPYSSKSIDDPNAPVGTINVTTKGMNGVKQVCTRGDGTAVSTDIYLAPTDEITSIGSKVMPAPSYIPPTKLACPITTCFDGTCSTSVGRGTCSWHGGEAY